MSERKTVWFSMFRRIGRLYRNPSVRRRGLCCAETRRRPPEETNVRSGERLKRSPAKAG